MRRMKPKNKHDKKDKQQWKKNKKKQNLNWGIQSKFPCF